MCAHAGADAQAAAQYAIRAEHRDQLAANFFLVIQAGARLRVEQAAQDNHHAGSPADSRAELLLKKLRNGHDASVTQRFDAESATLTSLLTQYNISLPSKLPYATQPRLDILTPPPLPNDGVTVQPAPQQ